MPYYHETQTNVQVGDIVTPTVALTEPRIGGDSYYGAPRMTVSPGDTGRITRVSTGSALVRFENVTGTNPFSIWINYGRLQLADGAVLPRRLGTPPEGDHIAPNDPRLAWLWDDISAYANKSNYCATFDTILREMGLPARKQLYTARGTLGDLEVTAQIQARSLSEANQILADRLVERVAEATNA